MPDEKYGEFIKKVWHHDAKPFRTLWEWAKEPRDPERRAERWEALEDWALRHARAERDHHDIEGAKEWWAKARVYRKKKKVNRKEDTATDVPGVNNGWHPEARRAGVVSGIGPLDPQPALVWHTTEGFGLPNYVGSNPHITADITNFVLYQHQSVFEGAKALKNLPGGVETNRGCVQVEIIGFAAQSHLWSEEQYDFLADLARWIELHCNVLRECEVTFELPAGVVDHMSASEWNAYRGHCGHRHVPENDHWDPGRLRIGLILDK